MSTLFTLLLSFSFFACGGASKGGEKSVSAYEELSGLSAALQAQVDETMAPVIQADAIITEFTELPKTLKLTPADFKSFIVNAAQGEIKAPEGMGAEVAGKLTAFGDRFVKFKEGLVAAPERVVELAKVLAESIVKVPVLVGKIEVEAQMTLKNPFASKADKAKAKKESEGAKKMGEEIIAKIKDIQTKVKELPSKATGALSKFTQSLASIGISNLSELTKAPGKMAQDVAKEVTK
jgi:hypothetical protein